MHYTRFHGKGKKQVRTVPFALPSPPVFSSYLLSFYVFKDYDAIHDLLTGSKARKSGIVYLEDESYTFRTKEGGRERSVYGSPVSKL